MKRNPLLERKDFNSKPDKTAKASDFDNDAKEKQNNVTSVTFNTNLKISNHTRNRLQSMVLAGDANTQKDMIDLLISSYMENATKEQTELLNFYYDSLEKRDVIKKNH